MVKYNIEHPSVAEIKRKLSTLADSIGGNFKFKLSDSKEYTREYNATITAGRTEYDINIILPIRDSIMPYVGATYSGARGSGDLDDGDFGAFDFIIDQIEHHSDTGARL